MRARGAIWVVSQFVLMAMIALAILVPPSWPEGAHSVMSVVGAGLVITGGIVAVWASRALRGGFTPFPLPRAGASLVTTGPFAYVRHPVYAGGLLVFVGWSLFAGVVALLLTAALALLWVGKIAVEERHLRRLHPGYDAYARRVRGRLVPGPR